VEIEEALRIVRALADGIDPVQADAHPPDANPSTRSEQALGHGADGTAPQAGAGSAGDSLLRNPQVVIALHRAIGALEAQAERESSKKAQPGNAFRYWSKAEDQQVCEELRQGLDFKEIATKHHRTVPSVVARLIKLGKIAPKASAPLFAEKAAS